MSRRRALVYVGLLVGFMLMALTDSVAAKKPPADPVSVAICRQRDGEIRVQVKWTGVAAKFIGATYYGGDHSAPIGHTQVAYLEGASALVGKQLLAFTPPLTPAPNDGPIDFVQWSVEGKAADGSSFFMNANLTPLKRC